MCGWTDRDIDTVYAVCRRTNPILAVLKNFKYDGAIGWGPILGRIVVGWLDANSALATGYDLIVVNPTHVGRTPIRHMELLLDHARVEDQLGWWPFEPPDDTTLVKDHPTSTATAHGTTWRNKKNAADELWFAVRVAHPERVAGARILIVDDVTTTLLQLNVLAGLLKQAGATEVDGLVIARQGG